MSYQRLTLFRRILNDRSVRNAVIRPNSTNACLEPEVHDAAFGSGGSDP